MTLRLCPASGVGLALCLTVATPLLAGPARTPFVAAPLGPRATPAPIIAPSAPEPSGPLERDLRRSGDRPGLHPDPSDDHRDLATVFDLPLGNGFAVSGVLDRQRDYAGIRRGAGLRLRRPFAGGGGFSATIDLDGEPEAGIAFGFRF